MGLVGGNLCRKSHYSLTIINVMHIDDHHSSHGHYLGIIWIKCKYASIQSLWMKFPLIVITSLHWGQIDQYASIVGEPFCFHCDNHDMKVVFLYYWLCVTCFMWYCAKDAIHLVTTMLATSKNVLFPGHSHLLTTDTDVNYHPSARLSQKCQ